MDDTSVRFVKTIGPAHGQLSPMDVDALKKLFLDNYYFNMQDSYEHIEITDAPSAKTFFNDGTRSKSVSHYFGDSSAPPVDWNQRRTPELGDARTLRMQPHLLTKTPCCPF